MQAISIKILENAKNDEQIFNILNRINSDFTFENYQDSIEEMLDEISGEITDEENIITISVYKQGKETVKLSINNDYISIEKNSNGITLKINDDEINFSIAKTSSAEEQENFDIIITVNPKEAEPSIININLSRVGAFTSNNVTFDMNISTKPVAEGNLNIELKNTVNFLAVPEFEEFKEENHLVINTLSQEQITNLFTNLGNLLLEKLKDEIYISMVKDLATTKNQMIQNATDILQTQEIQTFNSKFTVYEGVKKGAEIIGLQNIINSSNTTNVEHIVAYSGVSNEAIQTSKTYKVSLEQDLEGYVNKVIVEEFN